MKKRRELLIIIFILATIVISFYFDSEIVSGISKIKNIFLDYFFIGLSYITSEIIVFFFLTSLFLWHKHKRKWILPLWFTLFLSALISFLLKISIARPRPFQLGIVTILPVLEKASHLIWNFSFPSFQAMLVFCAIPILSKEFPKLKYYWIILAGLVAFSRVYFGLHFLSDVIAGGLIGYIIGMLIIRHEKQTKFWEKIYNRFF